MLREHHYGQDDVLRTYAFEKWCAELGLTAVVVEEAVGDETMDESSGDVPT